MKVVNFIALILIVVGAINWGLWGFFQFDFVAWFAGGHYSWMSRVIYAIVGLAGIWSLSFFGKCCSCKPKSGSGPGCCKK